MNPDSDAELLGRVRSGQRRAFAELYERYKRPLYAFCCRLLNDEAGAEDVVHDVFVKLHRGAADLTHPDRVRFWLFRVARNEAYMQLRRNGRATAFSDETVWEEQTPLTALAEKERSLFVDHALDRMKPEYREVLLLREYEGLSYAQIASVTGDTESSVRSRLFKARRELAAQLKPLMKEREG
jgi:RNA polymerase sigma-70 factor (ECF subfamily)